MDIQVPEQGIARPRDTWWQGALFRIKGQRDSTNGVLGLVEADFWAGMGTPLHVHHREDEAFYVLEGAIRFRIRDDEFTARSGDFVFGPRGVAHCFKVLEPGARALVLITPAGLEQMFVEGGIPVTNANPPSRDYDLEDVKRLARKYGFDIVGPPLE